MYPSKKWVVSALRNNLVSKVDYKVLNAFIVGSEAKGTAKEGSDLDIAVVIPASERRTALQRTEAYHMKFRDETWKPKWHGRIVDFQFFYESDPELQTYSKIPLA